MVIDAHLVNGATILFLTGDLDGPAALEVRRRVAGVIASGCQSLVLDLTGVERVYTAGLLVLSDLQQSLAPVPTQLSFCGARPFVREFLRITTLDRGLKLHLDLNSAMEMANVALS